MMTPASTSVDVLKTRLDDVHTAILRALDTGDRERVLVLVESREVDVRTLVGLLQQDDTLRDWTRRYLERERAVTARIIVERDEVRHCIQNLGTAHSVHKAYASGGMR
ncbi:MAG: hypothetical protein IV100_08830 [Myxococcales bacterium]|nr:hypothetical protein [Myxococcales bacterium]